MTGSLFHISGTLILKKFLLISVLEKDFLDYKIEKKNPILSSLYLKFQVILCRLPCLDIVYCILYIVYCSVYCILGHRIYYLYSYLYIRLSHVHCSDHMLLFTLNWEFEYCFVCLVYNQREQNIYQRGIYQKKSVNLPFCCTVSILQVYFTYLRYITFWALEFHFIENLKSSLITINQMMFFIHLIHFIKFI